MSGHILDKLKKINPLIFLWVAIPCFFLIAVLVNLLIAIFWYDRFSWDIFHISMLNALILSLIAAAAGSYLSKENVRLHEKSENSLQELDDLRLIETALQESEEKYRSLVDSTEDSIYLVDKDCRYLFLNRKHISRMGLSEDQMLGRAYGEFHSEQKAGEFEKNINRVFKTGMSLQHEHRSHRDNKYFLQTISPVRDKQGRTVAATVISKDITRRKQMEEKLIGLSLTDDLTGLYNRRGFFTLAEQQLKIANRKKRRVSLISIDLDNLKGINDKFGHQEGDEALREVADVLRDSFRESDIIARIGGDEFVVLQIENTNVLGENINARLQTNLERRNALRNKSYMLAISAGIAHYDPESPCSVEQLLARGDSLMYENKRLKQKT